MTLVYAHKNGAFYELSGENAEWMHKHFGMPLLKGSEAAEETSMTGFKASCLALWQERLAEKGHRLCLVDGQ